MSDQNFRVKRGLEVGVGKTVFYADPGGNIGIRNNAPISPLDILLDDGAGDPRIRFDVTSGDDPVIELNRWTGNGTNYYGIRAKSRLGDLTLEFPNSVTTIGSHSYSEKLRITSAGNVGVGTDNPLGSAALTNNDRTLAVGIITTNTLFSGDVKSSTADITTLTAGTINATTINANIEGVAEGVKVETVGINSEFKFGLIPDHVTSGASAIFLDSQTDPEDYLSYNTNTNRLSTSGRIVAGRGTGSVALTFNDGYGNANVAFNHEGGIPDVNGSSARIRADVDSNTANIRFQLSNSVSSGVAVSLADILHLKIAEIISYKTIRPSSNNSFDLGKSSNRWNNLFVKSINATGVSTFQDKVHLLDDDILHFGGAEGDSGDLQIYHDGANSYVSDQGTGDLRLSGNVVKLNNQANTATMIKATQGGSVELYHDNNKKFETTGIGVSIINGTSDTATISAPANLIIDPAVVGDNTGLVRIKGDLFVDGTQTIVNSSIVEIADKVVGIATTSTTEVLLDGAGIGIGPDSITKTFLYNYNGGTNPSLKSSENLNVATGKVYQIAETERLSVDTLSLGTGTTIHSPGSNILTFGTNGSERLRITSTGVIQLSNISGAYTSGTATRFSLLNDTNNHYGLHVGNDFDLNYNAGGSVASGKGEHVFHTAAAERLRISSSGHLTPGANGSQDLGSSSKRWDVIYANSIDGTLTGTISNATNANKVDITNNTSSSSDAKFIHFGNLSDNYDGVEVDSSSLVYQNRSLGIGVANPTSKLDVMGDINFNTNVLISSNASSSNIDHIWHDDNSSFGTGGTWNFVSDSTRKATGNSAIQIGYLKSSGGGHFLDSVGIGTTNPSGTLHLSANNPVLRLTDANQATDNKSWNIAAGTAQILRIQAINDAGNGGGQLFDFYRSGTQVQKLLGRNGGSYWFAVDNNNRRVGIGTDNPQHKLNVYNQTASATGGILVQNITYASNEDRPYLTVGTKDWTGATTNWNTFGFEHRMKSDSGGSPRITVDSLHGELFTIEQGGDIGIGVANPTAKLDVNGDIHVKDKIATRQHPSNSFLDFDDDNIPGVLGQSGSNYVTLGAISGLNLIFDTNNNDDNGLVIGSGDPNTANATKHMVISGAGLVGIGSTIPAAKLDVDGNILPSVHNTHNIGSTSKRWNTIFATNVNATTITGSVTGTADNANNVQITNNTSSSSTAKFIHFGDLSNNYDGVEVDSSSLVFKDRKFGIRQTNPGAFLDIGGNTDGNIQAILTRGADANFQLQFRNETSSNDAHTVTGKFGLFRHNVDIVGMRFRRGSGTGAGSLDFTTGGVERVRIDSDGNVGIGTDNPSGLTHWVAPSDMNLYLKSKNATGTIRWNYEDEGGTVRANHAFVNFGNGKTDFFTWATHDGSSLAERLRITSAGNVGIGTDDPEYKLQVEGDIKLAPQGTIFFDDESGTVEKIQATGSTIDLYADSEVRFFESDANSEKVSIDVNNSRIFFNGDDNTYWHRPASDTHAFVTAGSERLRITSAGRVGIGTDNVGAKLEIAGTGSPALRIRDLDGDNQFGQIVSNNGLLLLESRNGNSDGEIVFRGRDNTGTNEYGRFNASGHLTPGTDSSQDLGSSSKAWNKIYVNEIIGDNTIVGTISNATNATNVNITDDTGNSGTHYVHFGSATSGFDGVEVDSNGLVYKDGKIGIGTNNPAAKLDVKGDINFNNNVIMSANANSNNIDHIWHDDNASFGRGGTWNFVSDSTRKATGNSAIQIGFLKSSGGGYFSGFVGIGTTNPVAELDVRGYARFGPLPGAVGAATTFQGISLINGKDSSAAESISFVDFSNNLDTTDAHIFAKHQTDGGASLVFGTTPPGDRTTNRRVDNLTITADGGTQLYSVGNGGTFSTGNTGTNWWKVGEFVRVSQGFRGHLKILGASSFGDTEKSAGATYVNLVIENSNNVEGSFYGVTAGNETIQDVRVKYTSSTEILEVYVRPQSTFAGISVIPYGSGGGWTAFATNTGSTGNPSGTIAIPSEYNLTTGGNIRLKVESDGDVLPGANGSQDLGSSSKRWDVIYANSIDGTLTGTVTNANNVNINNITPSNDTKKFIHFGDLNNGYDGVEVDSTTLVYRNKNIGIGTDNPKRKLHVSSSGTDSTILVTGTTPQIRLNSNAEDSSDNDRAIFGLATANNHFISGAVSGDAVLRTTNGGNLIFGEGTTETLRITAAGDVGIGVQNPNEALDVNGSALIRTRAAINISTLPSEGNLTVYGSGKNSLIIQTNDNSSSRGIAFRNSGNAYTGFISMEDRGGNHADMVFGVDNGNETSVGNVLQRLRITKEGHIGVGTTLPDSAVASNNNQILHVGIITARQLYVDEISGDTVSGTIENANKVNITDDTGNSGTHYIHFGSATSGFDGVEVDSGGLVYKDGKVGIHSASPETGLDIRSNDGVFIRTTTNNPTNGARIQFSDQTSATQRGHIKYKHADNSISPGSNDGFLIGGTENLTVVKVEGRALIDEKVGIGTDVIARGPLHIHNPSTSDCQIHLTNDNTGTTSSDGLTIFTGQSNGDCGFVSRESGGSIEFYTHNGSSVAERLRIKSDGDLLPGGNGTQNLGSNSKKWKDIYLSGEINLSGNVEINQLLVTGISTFKDKVHLLDNDKLHFGGAEGDSGDLQIYHDGNNSYVQDAGTGNLILSGTRVNLLNPAANETMVSAQADGPVELYHNNLKKLETGQYGVTVTGTLAASNIDLSDELNFVGPGHKNIDFFTKNSGGTVFSANLRLVNHDASSFETGISMVRDGAVELYHGMGSSNAQKKFETTSTGAKVIGDLEVSGVLTYDDVSNIDSVGVITARSGIHVTGGSVGINTTNPVGKLDILGGSARVTNTDKTNIVELTTDGNIEIKRTGGGAFIDFADDTGQDFDARIQHNSGLDFYTGIHGDSNNPPQLRLGISTVGHLIPGANGSQDLGSSSKRWNVIYANSINATSIVGTISGTITNAEKIKVTENDNNQTCYLTFINRDPNSLQEDLFGDDNLQYNPNSNDLSTTGDIVAGRGSGSIALTINDSEGNSNVTFNHQNGIPDQNGNSGRIRVNTDRSGGATAFMGFELKDNVAANTDEELSRILTLNPTSVVPGSNNSIDLGSTSLKWNNVHANTFNGTFQGNATTATTATNANNVDITNNTSSSSTAKFIHFGNLSDNYDGVEVDSTTLVYRNRNIGIGTDDPQGKVHVESAAATAGWQIRTDSAGLDNESGFFRDENDDYECVLRNGAGGLGFIKNNGGASDPNLHFHVGTTEKMRITSDGVVGINATTGFDTAVALAVRNGASGSDHTMIDIIANTNETSRVVFSDDANHNQGRIQYNHNGNSLGFYTNGNTERISITNVGDLLPGADDSQEIGSSSKVWSKIYVNEIIGDDTITGTIDNANNVNINNITSSNDTKKFIHFGDLNNGYDGVEVDSTTLVYRNKNFGIGTDNPTALLHAQNNSVSDTKIIIESTGTNSYPALRLKNDVRTYDLGIDGATDALRFYDVTGSTERLRITSTGVIQLSNLSSAYTSGTATRFSLFNDTNNHYGLHVGGSFDLNYNAGGSVVGGKGEHVFHTAAAERLRITSGGNVGIGTNDPKRKLHVSSSTDSTILVTGTTPQIRLNSVTADGNDDDRAIFGLATANNHFISGAVGGDAVLRTTNGGNLIFGEGTTETLRITNVGNLLPGADNSQEIGSSSKVWSKIYVNEIIGDNTIAGTIDNANKLGNQLPSYYLNTSSTSQTKSGQLIIDTDNNAGGALRILADQTNPSNHFYFAQEIVSTLSGSTATGGDKNQGGIHIDVNSTATGGDTSNEHRAYGIFVDLDSTGDSDAVYGVYSDATATPTTGTVSEIAGVYGRAEDNGGDGNVTNVYGVRGLAVSDNSTSDTNNMYGGHFKSQPKATTGDIGSAHGVYAEIEIPNNTGDHLGAAYVFRAEFDDNDTNDPQVAQSCTSYLYYGNYAGTLPTNPYGVYINDNVPNYFGGSVLAGGPIDANSSAKLQVNGFQRTGTIFLHVGTSPTSTNHALSNNSGTLQWDGNNVLTQADLGGGTIDGKYLRSDVDDTAQGKIKFEKGIENGNLQGYADYDALIDMGSTAGTEKRIISASLANVNFSTIAFSITVIDNNSNHANTSSVNNVETSTYIVNMVRTDNTTANTPDQVYIRGPKNKDLIRARKVEIDSVSTGNYEVTLRSAADHREYRVIIKPHGVNSGNGTHTINYHGGDTPSTAVQTYTSSVSNNNKSLFQGIVGTKLDIEGDSTFDGDVIVDTATNSKFLYISRLGSTSSEYTKIGRDDTITHFHTNNDEETSTVRFRFQNTGGTPNDRNIDLISDGTDARITIDGNRVLTQGDLGGTIIDGKYLRSDTDDTMNGILTVGGSSVSGNEGGEIRLTLAPNSNLSNIIAIDNFADKLRFLEGSGGSAKGAFLDLANCDSAVGSEILHSGSAAQTKSGNMTFTGNVTIEDSELKVGDVSGDSYVLIKQVLSDDYGFDWQHNNASVFINEQGTTNQALVLGDVDANNTYSGLFGISHTSNGGTNWTKKLDLRGDGDLYIGSSAQNKVLTEADLGGTTIDGKYLRSDVADTAAGLITFDAGLKIGSNQTIDHHGSGSRDKIRVWNNSAYAIGMDNAMSFGGLNDYAMTFQMNNDADRGWVFLDNNHTDAQGAMSLTTQGKMTVAHSLRLGHGENDTTTPGATDRLDVSGSAIIQKSFTSDTDYHLFIKQTDNAEGATIKFTDHVPGGNDTQQFGLFTYKHSDGASNSAGNSFHFDSSESSTAVIIDQTAGNSGFYVGTNKVLTTADLGGTTVDGKYLRSDQSDTMNGILEIGGTSVSGGEGGELHLTYSPNTTLAGSFVVVDVQTNVLRFFENSSPNKGAFLNLATCDNTVGSEILHSGSTAQTKTGNLTLEGDVTFTGALYNALWDKSADKLKFSDNAKATFGADDDLRIYHDGGTSFIEDAGVGNLHLKTNGSEIKIEGSSTSLARFFNGGSVELHHNGNRKLETTSTGAKITGNLEVTGVLSYDDVTNIDSVGIITAQAGIHVTGGLVGIHTTTGFDTSVALAVRNGQSGSDHTMIDIIANTNETSRVVFSDDADHNQGRIQYNHNGNSLGFYTNGDNERLKISLNGHLKPGADDSQDIGSSNLSWNDLYVKMIKDKDNNSGSNNQVLQANNNGQLVWVDATDVGGSVDTKYDLLVPSGTTAIRLEGNTESGNVNDDITITGGSNISVTRTSATELTIATSGTLSGTTTQANKIKISTANGDEYKNITFVDRDTTTGTYEDLKIDQDDDTLSFNPSANILKTANITVTGNTIVKGELNLVGDSNIDRFIDARTGNGKALHIRTTAGGDSNHEFAAVFRRNAEVSLFYDASEKFRTTSTGIKVDANSGNLGSSAGDFHELASFETNLSNSSYLKIIDKRDSNGSDWTTAYTRIQKTIDVTDQGYIQFNGADNNYGMEFGTASDEKFAVFKQNDSVILYYDNGEKFRTQSAGAKVTGELKVTNDIVAFHSSDERLKDNLTTIDNPLDKVLSLGGYTFDWNENTHKEGSDTGVIAQQVEALGLPGVVTTRDDGYKAVRYEKLVPLLIESIKEMKGEMDELRDMVRELKNKCEDRD